MRRLAGRKVRRTTWAWRALGAVSALGVLVLGPGARAEPAPKPASSAQGAASAAARPSGSPASEPKAPAPKSAPSAAPKPTPAPASKASAKPAAGKAGSGVGTSPIEATAQAGSEAAGAPTRTTGKPNGTASEAAEPGESRLPVTAPKPALPKPKFKGPAPKPGPPKSHQRGRPPRQPSPTLPPGASRSEPNEAARRVIAAGPTGDESRATKADPELRALSEAEKVLFPRPLAGMTPGWSWDLPRPVQGSGPTVSSSGAPPAGPRELENSEPSREDAAWLKSLALPNLPVRLDARVVKYLKFYRDSPKGRGIVRVWAQKSGKYAPSIQAELGKAGLPTDLVWLSLIESGHNPNIQSPAGAVGIWQFVP
jgi:hypothetical protein